MGDELVDLKSPARRDQAQRIWDANRCLAESLESQERDVRMTREIEPLLNDHDNTYAHTMTNLEKRLDAKADFMMRKIDEILSGSNRENRPTPMRDSRRATDKSGNHDYAGVQPRSRTNFEPDLRERPRAVPSRSGWTDPATPKADATPGAHLPTMPKVRLVPDLTTVSQDTTMYASMFGPLNRSLETFTIKLSKSAERGERSWRTLKKPKLYNDESDVCIDT